MLLRRLFQFVELQKKKEWDFDKAPVVAVSMGSTEVDVHHV